ncbi:MAG TPA: NUDIX hydrolase [Hyphomicrobiaceae bacterium]|nr:NUDIX hydrolase [Hyphomicrobiaceae bacterium]
MIERREGWPRCGASAAIFREDEVLLIQRAKGAYTGLWSLPGGHVEPGETARHAAQREVLEETGIEAEIGGLLDVHDIILRGEDDEVKVHYMIAVFWGRWKAGEPVALTDSRASRFWRLGEIDGVPMTPGTLDFIRRAAAAAA